MQTNEFGLNFVEFEGEIYYIMEKGITTADFIIPQNIVLKKLATYLFEQKEKMSFGDIVICIQAFHNTPRYFRHETAKIFVDYLIDNLYISPDAIFTLRWLLPVQCSILRGLKRQREAIAIFEKERKRIENKEPLILPGISMKEPGDFILITKYWTTSVSAAYCDLGDKERAIEVLEMCEFSANDTESDLFQSLLGRIRSNEKSADRKLY